MPYMSYNDALCLFWRAWNSNLKRRFCGFEIKLHFFHCSAKRKVRLQKDSSEIIHPLLTTPSFCFSSAGSVSNLKIIWCWLSSLILSLMDFFFVLNWLFSIWSDVTKKGGLGRLPRLYSIVYCSRTRVYFPRILG